MAIRKIKPEKIEDLEPSLNEAKEIFPRFRASLEHLPEAKKWEIGKTYHITLEIRQTSIGINKNERRDSGFAGFDITGIEVVNQPTKKSKKFDLPDKA